MAQDMLNLTAITLKSHFKLLIKCFKHPLISSYGIMNKMLCFRRPTGMKFQYLVLLEIRCAGKRLKRYI